MVTERPEPALSARGLSFAYPGCGRPVFENVVFSTYPGERVALIGPSGCGKTTFLRLLEGSLNARTGEVLRHGRVVLVYQDHRLVAEDSVLNNVCAGALFETRGTRFSAETRGRAKELLVEVGLGGLERRRVSELSGGQQQRVAIARALMARPEVVLADEPFAFLDTKTAHEVADVFTRLQERHGFALVCSVHDAERVPGLFHRQVEFCQLTCPVCPVGKRTPLKRERRFAWAPLGWTALAVALAWSIPSVFQDAPPLGRAMEAIGKVFPALFPGSWAEFAALPWASLASALLSTIQMAVVGTAIGVMISLPLAILASLPGRPTAWRTLARGLSTVIRSVPALLWALFFVAVVGIGPAAGVAGLAAYSTGYLTRLFNEELENVDDRPARALLQMGAGRFQALLRATLRPATPGLAGAGFFVFEYNVRGASVLGLVGAGGIGADLAYYLEWRQFPQFFAGMLMLLAVAVVLESISRRMRTQLSAQRGC